MSSGDSVAWGAQQTRDKYICTVLLQSGMIMSEAISVYLLEAVISGAKFASLLAFLTLSGT